MEGLFVGVVQVSLHFRHAQSLKDKRHSMKSLSQKLKNQGFSVSECGHADLPKQGLLGFTYAGHSHGAVEHAIEQGLRLFVGEFEVLRSDQDIFDYSDNQTGEIPTDDEPSGWTPPRG